MKELLEFLLEQTARVYVGLYGLLIFCLIGNVLIQGTERVVKWIENRINSIKKIYSLHKQCKE